MLADKCSR